MPGVMDHIGDINKMVGRTHNRGVYKFGVSVWQWRRTKYWTQAEIDHAKKEAEKLAKRLDWR